MNKITQFQIIFTKNKFEDAIIWPGITQFIPTISCLEFNLNIKTTFCLLIWALKDVKDDLKMQPFRFIDKI